MNKETEGSGSAPQLDERARILEMERDWLLGAWAAMAGIPQAHAEAEMLKHTSKFRGEALAASPGAGEAKERIERMRELTEEVGRLNKRIHGRAGELDLTDGEVQAILRNLPTEPGFHLGFGGNFNAAVAKLRARLDRKDDDG